MSSRMRRLGRVEEVGGEALDQLGLAHAGAADEDEAHGLALGAAVPTRLRLMAAQTASTASSWPTMCSLQAVVQLG